MINSLFAKYDVEDADVSEEIQVLRNTSERQKEVLQTSVEEQVENVKIIGQMLSNIK